MGQSHGDGSSSPELKELIKESCGLVSLLALLLEQASNDERADAKKHKDPTEGCRCHLGDGRVLVLGSCVLKDTGEFCNC